MGLKDWLLLLLLSMLWGSSFYFVEIALRDLPPLLIVAGRLAIAALTLNLILYLRGERLPRSPRVWLRLFQLSCVNNLVPFNLIVWGQQYIEGSLAAILNATTPLFTVVLAHWLTADEKLTYSRLSGVTIGFGGVIVLVGPTVLSGLGWDDLGQFAILGAALSYGLAGIYGRRLSPMSPTVVAAGSITVSALVMLIIALASAPGVIQFSPATGMALLSLGVFSTASAYLIYFSLLTRAGATYANLVAFLIPLSASLLGIALLDERLPWSALVGMAVIFVGLAVMDGRLPPQGWQLMPWQKPPP